MNGDLRRFGPLIAVFGLAILALLARFWDVQILQHEVWARESVNLVRSHAVEPYVRGSIRARDGQVLVHDEETYALEFVWRDFRRGHPLGQVAMMRSLALMRPVGLDEARRDLSVAAASYASLTPNQIEEFATGGELDAFVDYVPAIAAEDEGERRDLAREERRRSRAGDLTFYIVRLLDLAYPDAREIDEMIEDGVGGGRSYADLAGEVTDRTTQEVHANLRARVVEAETHLVRLAGLIDWDDPDGMEPGAMPIAAGDRLVAEIEATRGAVEADAADALFRIAAGFSARRLGERNLSRFDLDWLKAALDWDELRLDAWRRSRGASFDREALEWMAGHTITRTKIGDARPADRVVSAIAHAFRADAEKWTRKNAAPQDWRQVDDLEVLGVLPSHVEGGDEISEDMGEAALPFQSPDLRVAAVEGDDLLLAVLDDALETAANSIVNAVGVDTSSRKLAKRLIEAAGEQGRDWDKDDARIVAAILWWCQVRVERRAEEMLDAIAAATGVARISFAAPFVEKALETRRYVVRDRGGRAKEIGGEPPFDLVRLVTRYPTAFAGFRVASKMRRVPLVTGAFGRAPLAEKIVGRVRSPLLVEILEQRPEMEKLAELQAKLELPEDDEREILGLIDRAYQPHEKVGGSGIEAWFNTELSGRSGYREVLGLQDRVDENRAPIYRGARDGQDVTLTIDVALQRSAEEVITRPEMPEASDHSVDEHWFNAPVGAILLATTEGEILCAASSPIEPGLPVPEYTDGQRQFATDRTLRRPWGQPAGSVVKPLIAAYALEYLDLDPEERLAFCDIDLPRLGTHPKKKFKRAGWGKVDCNSTYGHSKSLGHALDLGEALERSCNVYFAALAELRFDPASMREAYELFGFGKPTGVRYDPDSGRQGLVDSYWYNPKSPLHASQPLTGLHEVARQRLGNGLVHVDVNVVQIARAYAGLATGMLPEMMLVRAVGDQEIPRRVRALGISEEHLELIRGALDDVVHAPAGTAEGVGLGEESLEFRFAAKTGSADYHKGFVPPRSSGNRRKEPLGAYEEGMRKHTWVAGWFPSAAPEYVLVVYVHDTSATASHSAVYVARQFLKTQAVRRLMGIGTE